jgi:NAD(P)-dependent dehydrogenase (short-subunit alcohol dehydrogenase family)
MPLLTHRIAVVTGGSSGIGLATAKRFVDEGAYVFIAGRRQAELDKAVVEIGENVTAIEADVSKLDDLDRLYTAVAEQKGTIDVIFACPCYVERVLTKDVTPKHFDLTFDTTVRGTYFTVQKALPIMNDGGSIILIGSVGPLKGFPTRSTYNGAKAALGAFVRTWTNELKGRNIRANVLSPGAIQTSLLDSQWSSDEVAEQTKNHLLSMTPLGRLGRPEEVAAVALFLASDESSFITGVDLYVDGGMAVS